MTVAELNETAIKYRKELMMLPIIGLQDSLQHMSLRPGIQYKEVVGTILGNYQVKPYTGNIDEQGSIEVKKRELEVFRGDVITYENLEDLRKTIVGKILGDLAIKGKMKTPNDHPMAKQIIALMIKNVTKGLNDVLFSASRNGSGTTTSDLFNGFDTITSAEITAGKISAAKRNLVTGIGTIDATNALDKLKGFYRNADLNLRRRKTIMAIDPDILDAYQDNYVDERGGVSYNNKFEQTFLEGSRGMCELVPFIGKAGSGIIQLTTKENFLVGVDQESDKDFVNVREVDNPYLTQFVLNLMFGTEFESVYSENLLVGTLA